MISKIPCLSINPHHHLQVSLNRLLWPSHWMLAALPHNRFCTDQLIFLNQSAYLDQNLYRAGYSGQIHQDWHIQRMEELYVNMHMWPANWRFGIVVLWNCYQLGWVPCLAEVASLLESAVYVGRVEVNLFLWVSSVTADSFQHHCGKEDSRTFGFDEAMPGVFRSQP